MLQWKKTRQKPSPLFTVSLKPMGDLNGSEGADLGEISSNVRELQVTRGTSSKRRPLIWRKAVKLVTWVKRHSTEATVIYTRGGYRAGICGSGTLAGGGGRRSSEALPHQVAQLPHPHLCNPSLPSDGPRSPPVEAAGIEKPRSLS